MTVSNPVILGLACAALISLVAPFVIYDICRSRMALPARNILIGAAVFVLFALVLESALHVYVLGANHTTAAWLAAHPWGYVAYGAAAAALFEETGRFLAMRFVVKPAGEPATAVSYALGHGGIETLLVGAVAQSSTLFMALLLNAGRLDTTIAQKVSPAELLRIHAELAHLDLSVALLGGLERVWALLIQVALSLLVWRAVSRGQLRWFLMAIALHAAVDASAAMYQRGLAGLPATEAFVTALGLGLTALFLAKLPRSQPAA